MKTKWTQRTNAKLKRSQTWENIRKTYTYETTQTKTNNNNTLKTYKQKEKAFAFDCFEAGRLNQFDEMICSKFYDETTFEKFYAQYAEQHTK